MGSIQSNLNQSISVAGLLYSQTATFKNRQQMLADKRSRTSLNKQYDKTKAEMNNLDKYLQSDELETEDEISAVMQRDILSNKIKNIDNQLVGLNDDKAIGRAAQKEIDVMYSDLEAEADKAPAQQPEKPAETQMQQGTDYTEKNITSTHDLIEDQRANTEAGRDQYRSAYEKAQIDAERSLREAQQQKMRACIEAVEQRAFNDHINQVLANADKALAQSTITLPDPVDIDKIK